MITDEQTDIFCAAISNVFHYIPLSKTNNFRRARILSAWHQISSEAKSRTLHCLFYLIKTFPSLVYCL